MDNSEIKFVAKSKKIAYLLFAILISMVLALEDIVDEDKTPIELVRDFFGIAILLSLVLLLVGFLFRQCRTLLLSISNNQWKYFDSVVTLIWIVVLPILTSIILSFVFLVDTFWIIWVSQLILFITTMATELFWIVLEKRQSLENTNRSLLRSNVLAKYQALINQLSPHFLFNSLNVLSILIYKDQKKAEQFVEELGSVYRYILELNETYLVPLKQEIQFIESYFFLQKIRFHDNLTYETNIDAQIINKRVPPMTLEVLVENAIKHNSVDKDQPLHIEIFTEGNYLMVVNNIQPLNGSEVKSTQVGLKNLLEKFTILGTELPEFVIKNGYFQAKVPLI